METGCDWQNEISVPPVRGGENSDSLNVTSRSWLGGAGNSSNSSEKDTAVRKRVQFLNEENKFTCDQSNSDTNSVPRIPMAVNEAADDCLRLAHGNLDKIFLKKTFGEGQDPKGHIHSPDSESASGVYAFGDHSLSTGHLDWLWSEEAERQDQVSRLQGERGATSLVVRGSDTGESSNDCFERETECRLPVFIGEEGSRPDPTMPAGNNPNNFKVLGSVPRKKASGAWASFLGGDSARWSSMSLTDLVESSRRKIPTDATRRERSALAPHLQLAGSSLASEFFKKEADVDCLWPCSPAHSSLSTSSTPRRDVLGSKVEPRSLSIKEPNPNGNLHGILHCTLLAGLPHYTFLVDEYDEAVTAKIWMEDVILGEQQGLWRYTFYSLKGDSRKKGKNGWKHWRKKEKLASELVGAMKASSVLCSEAGLTGGGNLWVESEFVLLSARAHDPLYHAHSELLSQTSSLSLETASHGCSKVANPAIVSIPRSPSQSCASSSDGGLLDLSSPGAISPWYVTQSLIPSSVGSPELAAGSKQKARKWSLQSGISGKWIGNTDRRSRLSSNMSTLNSSSSMDELHPGETYSLHQSHAEVAAMIISVPLEMQEYVAEPAPFSDASGYNESHLQEFGIEGFQTSWEEPIYSEAPLADDHIRCMKHIGHDRHPQARITVILPSGKHGRPLSDMRGPSPLIKRWKEGGKCDCSGWDLGCGLLVLKNEHSAIGSLETSLIKGRDDRAHSNTTLTLYRQEATEEESYISLTPQENGLIAVDFRSPLSPLQAFAVTVAILHGRGSGVPKAGTSCEMTTTMGLETQLPEKKTSNHVYDVVGRDQGISSSGYSSSGGKPVSGHMHLAPQTCSGQEIMGRAGSKTKGSKVFGCGSELALSCERV